MLESFEPRATRVFPDKRKGIKQMATPGTKETNSKQLVSGQTYKHKQYREISMFMFFSLKIVFQFMYSSSYIMIYDFK